MKKTTCKKDICLKQETAHTKKGVYHLDCYMKSRQIISKGNISRIPTIKQLNSKGLSSTRM
jgi:hypothetical protein